MIGFVFKVTNNALERLVHDAILDALPDHELEVSGFSINLKVLGAPNIQADNKTIQISLPLGVGFSRQAGLFTVQGHGKIHVKIASRFDVSPDLNLTTKSAIEDHIWLEKPVIDFGSLDITVEKLVDLILKHYHDMIVHSIDKGLKTKFSLSSVVDQLLESLRNDLNKFSYHGLKVFLQPSEIIVEPIYNEAGKMVFRGGISTSLVCTLNNPFEPKRPSLRWVDNLLNDNLSMMRLDIAEEVISEIVCEFINKQEYGGEALEARECKVDFSPTKMDVVLLLEKPIKAKVMLKGSPRYNEAESKLYIDKLDIDMKASNIIYRLTAPLVNRFLESSFEEKLPVAVDSVIKEQISTQMPLCFQTGAMEVNVVVGKVSVVEMKFDDAGLKALVKIEDFEVRGEMN